MIYYSPRAGAGSGGDSLDDLQERIIELQNQIVEERNKHKDEMSRGLEAVDRIRRTQPTTPNMLVTVDGHDLSSQQRVAIFVDVQNMYYAARNLYQSKLEFATLLKHLVSKRVLQRALAYIVERPGMEQNKFIEVLRRNGYEVRKRVVGDRTDPSNSGDWNIGITLDALAIAPRTDVCILVTGDGDFVPLVERLKNEGVRVEIASFRDTTSNELYQCADQVHHLDERVLLSGNQFQPSDSDEELDDDDMEYEEQEELVTAPSKRRARGPVDDDFDDEDDH
ncbi:MAG: NYN domain-containing protein [Planctomycetia bacterium]|nr:NYN domain-containing protein [Planctomycetia bacterium]MBL6913822.1 NYN domain-containing protein [Planctomycetota bacterium]